MADAVKPANAETYLKQKLDFQTADWLKKHGLIDVRTVRHPC